jgi:hypothetical protein
MVDDNFDKYVDNFNNFLIINYLYYFIHILNLVISFLISVNLLVILLFVIVIYGLYLPQLEYSCGF